jgi:hypothetical protein
VGEALADLVERYVAARDLVEEGHAEFYGRCRREGVWPYPDRPVPVCFRIWFDTGRAILALGVNPWDVEHLAPIRFG